jgi:hypothetical protein
LKPAGRRQELISPRTAVIAALCVTAVVFAVYWSSLDFQFILDDHRFVNDPRVQSSGHIWDYFANYVWAQFTGGPPSFYRPVFILWMRVNFMLSELSPWEWHLLSITNHAAVALLLGLLAGDSCEIALPGCWPRHCSQCIRHRRNRWRGLQCRIH